MPRGLMLSGQLNEVLAAARRGELPGREAAAALREHPGKASALHLLGLIALDAGDAERAVCLLENTVHADGDNAAFRNNLGVALREAGRTGLALGRFREAARLAPNAPEPLVNAGALLRRAGEGDRASRDREAECHFRRAAELSADPSEALFELGKLFAARKRWSDAIDCFESTLAHQPCHGGALCASIPLVGDRRAAELSMRVPEALRLTRTKEEQSDIETALAFLSHLRRDCAAEADHYRRALFQCPDNVAARVNLAKLLLLQGDFIAGWHAFEWRWRQPETILRPRPVAGRLWTGEPIEGASILLHAEQGYGDAIQFVRYVPLVAAAGGRVILEVPRPLSRLMRSAAGPVEMIERGEPAPRTAWHCPLMSLPFVFGTTPATIPRTVPYLRAPAPEAEAWSSRLRGPGLRIGIVWAGSPAHRNDRRRSLPPALLTPLSEIGGATFVSLQKTEADAFADGLPFPCVNAGAELSDFAVTAGIVDSLDVVVSVDTAVAHLAGALGKPVWILLPFAGEYRWLLDREDSPWYPTARLFRQPAPGDWVSVITRVAQELKRFAGERR